ncbi:Glutaredoxin [Coemansia sp. RSA 2706]|nr:Glutaredoxin [Coemansia sp. RSA 2711]KAJ1840786.1 Glutaredoxin [Coemansia sp. RSA 2708]KAJ2297616.1 Glutaredoxin [Coemansia sp. RSA 2706]KAJ2310050.1 Glutaredoxin [Coemansia sp. RSA 2705]KAJ2322459.1 Glutaredoxin [Coemansia sp. RSA 2702]KAJ2373646.1 Glutaredoxin [Coemansia sp. RSA 2611]KAJ2731809.1 Glutaredoxin [Coemansia sp. Cherry 401B]
MPAASKAATELAKRLIASNKVMMFAKSYCPYCHRAQAALKGNQIDFFLLDLDTRKENDGQAIQDSLLKLTGQRTVPNIFVNGHHVGGCSETLDALDNGSLLKLLEGKPGAFAAKDNSAESSASATPASIDEARM